MFRCKTLCKIGCNIMSHIIAFLLGVNFATKESYTVVNTNFPFCVSADTVGFIVYVLTLILTPILFLLILFSDEK